jgi:predicted small lipoprotein YifL
VRRRILAAVLAALAPLATLAGCGEKAAPLTTTVPTASAETAAPAPLLDGGDVDADTDAGTDAAADAAPPPPLYSEEPFPEKRTPMPKAAEWEAAPLHSLDRGSCICTVRRVREWIRLTGPWDGGLVLLGGSQDGLSLRKGEIIFPVRPGDRREIELLVNDHTLFIRGVEDTHLPSFAGVLSEQWIAGDERPSIVIQSGARTAEL